MNATKGQAGREWRKGVRCSRPAYATGCRARQPRAEKPGWFATDLTED